MPTGEALQKIRQKNTMRREVTVELSSQGFWKTGVRSDVCQVVTDERLRPAASPHCALFARFQTDRHNLPAAPLSGISDGVRYSDYEWIGVHAPTSLTSQSRGPPGRIRLLRRHRDGVEEGLQPYSGRTLLSRAG
ncbi:unnamed protein product [Boreogadus saida]